MFNTYQFDQTAINASTVPLTFSTDIIAFDSFGLQNANIITSEIDFDDIGGIELNSFKFPRENGGGVLSKFYRGRDIKLTITLKAASTSAFAALLDSFKQ